jgi:threonine dehydratase
VEEINLALIEKAAVNINTIICKTPLKKSLNLSHTLNKNIFLKIETMQHTGAFKLRGAANAVLNLSEQQRKAGVVTASSGNHGRAVAYVAKELGIRAVICLSTLVPNNKIAAIKQLGAEVVIFGDNQDLATEKAQQLAQQEHLNFISAFDHPDVIAGQGTIALEILQQQPKIDTIITQLSGGGLASGIAVAAKALNPNIKIIGVTISQGAAMLESIKAGRLVNVVETPSVADALTGPIPPDNQYTFNICSALVDEIVQVSEQEIIDAMVYSLTTEKLVLEGGGAATIAMLLAQKGNSRDFAELLGENVAVICSGDNVPIATLLGYMKS